MILKLLCWGEWCWEGGEDGEGEWRDEEDDDEAPGGRYAHRRRAGGDGFEDGFEDDMRF